MHTIKTKAHINTDRTLTVQLPADLQVGEYDVTLSVNSRSIEGEVIAAPTLERERTDKTMSEAWEQWFDEVEKLPLKETVEEKSFHEILVEKYRKQGLEL
ncbi:MAG: hypothetical protein WA902_00310 [Thermosynechococcaceae cyanobacterium]